MIYSPREIYYWRDKGEGMEWAERVLRTGEKKYIYRNVVVKYEGKRRLEKTYVQLGNH